MIAVSIPRRRIAFKRGLTDAQKKNLVMNLWIKNSWCELRDFPLPRFHEYIDLTKQADYAISDVVCF